MRGTLIKVTKKPDGIGLYALSQRLRGRDVARSMYSALCALALLFVTACAASTPATTASTEPRPIGVSESATAEERGRELLRVFLELVKHGQLRDTAFASRLLEIPVDAASGASVEKAQFPHGMARLRYFFPTVGPLREEAAFYLDRTNVCVQLTDFLSSFREHFGVGTRLIRVSPQRPGPGVGPDEGWADMRQIHSARSQHLQQTMPNGLFVEGIFSRDDRCAAALKAARYQIPAAVRSTEK